MLEWLASLAGLPRTQPRANDEVPSIKADVAEDAFREALRRYPEAERGLVFLYGASGLGQRMPTEKQLAWAREKASAIEARRAGTAKAGPVHESATRQGDARD
jgi:hypothetical protein